MTQFAANGLLGSSSSSSVNIESRESNEISFKRNGLLMDINPERDMDSDIAGATTTKSKSWTKSVVAQSLMALLVAASFTLTSLLSKAKAPLMQADANIDSEIDSTTSASTSHLRFGTSTMVDQGESLR